METRRLHQYIILVATLMLSSSFYTHFSYAYQKKINHQKQIALDYFGSPLISGDEYEKAMHLNYGAAKVKRQENRKTEDNNNAPNAQQSTAPSTSATTLPPSVSTSLDESDNVTSISGPPPSEPTSEIASSSTTTTEAITTLPTTPSTEEPPQLFPAEEGHSTKGYFCLCDYQVKVCDMNCCCDPDCSVEEKRVFKPCDDYSMIYDPSNKRNKDHSCFKSYIMYRENIPYRTDRTDKSMFCVVNDNSLQAREFSRIDMGKISKRISHGKIDTRPKYTWDSLYEESRSTTINYDQPYKFGSAIWAVRSEIVNGEESSRNLEIMFRLPAPFHNDVCSILEPVKYLQDSASRCVRPLRDTKTQCETLRELNANNFIRDLSIIINPRKLEDNSTDFITEQIIPVMTCHNTMHNCKKLSPEFYSNVAAESSEDVITEFPSPKLAGFFASDKCTNVLAQLNLTFVHQGIHGITKILAKALVVDIPLDRTEIIQEFKTEYIWSNAVSSKGNGDGTRNGTNASSVEDILFLRKLPRSGNPGYIVGKPLILGRMVMKSSKINGTDGKIKLEKKMHVLPDASQWLYIQGAGNCPLSHNEMRDHPRHAILFGYDHVSSCNLPIRNFQYCGELQRHIVSIIFGLTREMNPKEFIKTPLYVAAYGSPDAFPSDWVQLNFAEISSLTQESSQFSPSSLFSPGFNSIENGCGGITTAVHITVSYAYVGPVDAPQAKITGIFYEPEEPISIPDVTDETQMKDVSVTTTVSFLDVTGKPTTRVATFPVVSVQLPADFFYPFSSSTPGSGAKKSARNDYYSLSTSLAFLLLVFGTFVL